MAKGIGPTIEMRAGAPALRVWAAAAAVLAALIAGCGPSGPTESELRSRLLDLARKEVERYNQSMDRYTAPKWEVDGSSCSMMRSHLELAVKPTEVHIHKTGGRTTTFEAQVPYTLQSYIKSGEDEDICEKAPERRLAPETITYDYGFDTVTKQWHRQQKGGIGGAFGLE